MNVKQTEKETTQMTTISIKITKLQHKPLVSGGTTEVDNDVLRALLGNCDVTGDPDPVQLPIECPDCGTMV